MHNFCQYETNCYNTKSIVKKYKTGMFTVHVQVGTPRQIPEFCCSGHGNMAHTRFIAILSFFGLHSVRTFAVAGSRNASSAGRGGSIGTKGKNSRLGSEHGSSRP